MPEPAAAPIHRAGSGCPALTVPPRAHAVSRPSGLISIELRPRARAEALRAMDADVLKYGEVFGVASNVAEFSAAPGDRSKALEWLDRAVRAGDERAAWFERDPLLASIRQETRFREIVNGIRDRLERQGRKTP